MARNGVAAMRVPPLVPLPSSSNSNGGGFSASFTTSTSRFSSNVKNRECCFVACTIVVARSRGGITKFSGFGKYLRHLRQQQQLSRATVSDESSSDSTSAGPVATSPDEKEDLTAKLAAAEAEAEALRKELAARRGSRDATDLSKLKPMTPEKRIDGTGYRETIFSGPGNTTGTPEQQPNKWGLSEAELFLSKGAPTEGRIFGEQAAEPTTDAIVTRRLLISVGITVLAVGLAFLRFPTGRPSKPLFLYLVSILQLQQQLKSLEASPSDVEMVRTQLERAGTPVEIRDNFLSAAAWLDGHEAERASALAYSIFEYLDQADYSKYFESYGKPTSAQQMEFLKFSVQSVKAAREKVDEFLTLVPRESLDAAAAQFAR
ncbi:hypothetical protein CY35_02G051000 [Sphagnum magellanicum]|nr:hypothetical protein CY35_02G051000 [Sphagnum magellanicum]